MAEIVDFNKELFEGKGNKMEQGWAYDIKIGKAVIADSDGQTFATKEEAYDDAEDYIDTELSEKYEVGRDQFEIFCFKADIMLI